MFILHFIVIGMGRPFLIGCTNKVIIIIIIIIVLQNLSLTTFFLQHIEQRIARQPKSPTRQTVQTNPGQSRSQALSLCVVICPSKIHRPIDGDKFHKMLTQICIRKHFSYIE